MPHDRVSIAPYRRLTILSSVIALAAYFCFAERPFRQPTLLVHSQTAPSVIQFSSGFYLVREDDGRATITITRTGDASGAASVEFSAYPFGGDIYFEGCAHTNGIAYQQCDYVLSDQTVTWAA
ncbi:MAG: hypothetical protein LC800_10050, partial [Acidobacteria bacterium]|nr:hypothetical protein [Acidobacteriota bacterium]